MHDFTVEFGWFLMTLLAPSPSQSSSHSLIAIWYMLYSEVLNGAYARVSVLRMVVLMSFSCHLMDKLSIISTIRPYGLSSKEYAIDLCLDSAKLKCKTIPKLSTCFFFVIESQLAGKRFPMYKTLVGTKQQFPLYKIPWGFKYLKWREIDNAVKLQ